MHSLASKVSAVLKLLRLNAERGMAAESLGFPEQMILMRLYPDKTSNQDAIARTIGVDKGSIARTMAKLEEKGLITRVPNPANRRENLVSLAPKSAEILEDMRQNLNDVSERAFDGFTDEERAMVLDALTRIADNLRDEG